MSTHNLYIIYFLFIFYWSFHLILRHDVKNMFCIQIFTALNLPKYALPLIYIFPSTILTSYGKVKKWFCSYTGKHRSEKVNISAYFTQWLGRNNSFKLYWLHDFKSYLFSRTDCDRATCKRNYRKKVIKATSLSFCRQWVIAKAKTYWCSEKRLLIKFLPNLKRKTW